MSDRTFLFLLSLLAVLFFGFIVVEERRDGRPRPDSTLADSVTASVSRALDSIATADSVMEDYAERQQERLDSIADAQVPRESVHRRKRGK